MYPQYTDHSIIVYRRSTNSLKSSVRQSATGAPQPNDILFQERITISKKTFLRPNTILANPSRLPQMALQFRTSQSDTLAVATPVESMAASSTRHAALILTVHSMTLSSASHNVSSGLLLWPPHSRFVYSTTMTCQKFPLSRRSGQV